MIRAVVFKVAIGAAALIAAMGDGPAPAPTAPPDVLVEQATLAAERAAMDQLVNYDGVYKGHWRILVPSLAPGRPLSGAVGHRVGPFLAGTVKMMEGKNFSDAGEQTFHGMIVIHYDVPSKHYRLTVFANGKNFETDAVQTPTGYYFEDHNGSNAKRRINIVVTPTTWSEYVEQFDGTSAPVRIFEMTLDRVGPSDWPARTAG